MMDNNDVQYEKPLIRLHKRSMAMAEATLSSERYKKETIDDVHSCLQAMGCQPILFAGTGLSIRYINAPSWNDLLTGLADRCPRIEHPLVYYQQQSLTPVEIGELFAGAYREWAWSGGNNSFPKELFGANTPPDAYIKYMACHIIKEATDISLDGLKSVVSSKIAALKAMEPHSIITTNYDNMFEVLFPEYTPIVGQNILREANISVGEIFKVHGTIDDPLSVVLTKKDYDDWSRKKKYLSAKLLTYFAEHPLVIVGYSAQDPNIRSILQDIDEILNARGGLISNIYLIQRPANPTELIVPPRERVVDLGEGRSVRLKAIVTNDFQWAFEAFGTKLPLAKVDPRKLRALVARTYELIRKDIPKRTVEVDFGMLEHATSSSAEMAKLYGISTIDDPSVLNANWPYTLSQVGKMLGGSSWHCANKLIKEVKETKGVDLKSGDNPYHTCVKTGEKENSAARKYSDKMVNLLKKVRDKENYDLESDTV